MLDNITTLIFDLDDTLILEESTPEAVSWRRANPYGARCGIDSAALHAALREISLAHWERSPARAFCRAMGISAWEGLWGRFDGDDANLRALQAWAPEYRLTAWREALGALRRGR